MHMESENRHAFDETLRTFAHPRYELIATGEVYDGEDAVRGYYAATRTAFPDQRNVVHAIHHADDAVVVEFDLLGTHRGPLRGIPATGREFACRMVAAATGSSASASTSTARRSSASSTSSRRERPFAGTGTPRL